MCCSIRLFLRLFPCLLAKTRFVGHLRIRSKMVFFACFSEISSCRLSSFRTSATSAIALSFKSLIFRRCGQLTVGTCWWRLVDLCLLAQVDLFLCLCWQVLFAFWIRFPSSLYLFLGQLQALFGAQPAQSFKSYVTATVLRHSTWSISCYVAFT